MGCYEVTSASMTALVRPESLAQQAYQSIRRAIRDGKIARDQFFSETTFAQMLGVSRTPVREAIMDLYREGVVEIIAKRGFRLINLDQAAVEEIRLLRGSLECLIVSQLCKTITKEQVTELRHLLATENLATQDIFSVDEAFHMRMAEMAGLHHTKRVLLGLRVKMYLIARGASIAGLRNKQVVEEHAALLDRLAARDCEGALAVITKHIELSIDAFEAAGERRAATAEPLRQSL